jgi:hypothetical protein
MTTGAILFPQYRLAGLDPKTRAWLKDQCGQGPLELIDITDVCASCKVEAIVYDAEGNNLGRVDARGKYYTRPGEHS